MKQTKYLLFIILVVLVSSSCKKFLDVQPKDLKIPATVKDYQDLLNGEGWSGARVGNGLFFFLDFMSDDATEKLALSTSFKVDDKINYSSFYCWRNNYDFTYINNVVSTYSSDTWTWLYQLVVNSNIVLEGAQTATGATADKQFLMADAYFTRAMANYYLVNIWGQPYNPSTASSDLGVPIKTNTYPSLVGNKRNSVAEVYDVIINDLKMADSLVQVSGKTSTYYHVNKEASEIMLSRVYLYMQNWQAASDYANKAIATKPGLYDISAATFNYFTSAGNYFLNSQNNEIVFTYLSDPSESGPFSSTGNLFGTSQNNSTYMIADTTIYKYNNGYTADKRFNGFTLQTSSSGATFRFAKTMFQDTTAGFRSMTYQIRTAEAYLNRAEANAQLNNLTVAQADINLLRSKRIAGVTALSFPDQATALQNIYQERRRELLFQGHRWFDLRRQGMPSITHTYTPTIGSGATATFGTTQVFILAKNDPGYTLEIPIQELNLNPLITPLGLSLRQPQ